MHFLNIDPATVKFSSGEVVSTRCALAAMEEHQVSASALLQRHLSGDWGNVPVEDAQLNELAIGPEAGRVLSSYDITSGVRIWIITEWDRSVTTFLLPSEY